MKIVGECTIEYRNIQTGEVEHRETVKNTITNQIYNILVSLLGGTASGKIAAVQLGTGTTLPTVNDIVLAAPITPVIDGTDPGNTFTVSYPATYQVRFVAVLNYNYGNGFSISEAGLLTEDGILVARVIFTNRVKMDRYMFTFTWTLTMKSS